MDNNQVMFLTKLNVHREGAYSYSTPKPDAPLVTTVEVQGMAGKIEMKLSPEVGARIIAVMAEELAAHTRRAAEVMTADFLTASGAAQIVDNSADRD